MLCHLPNGIQLFECTRCNFLYIGNVCCLLCDANCHCEIADAPTGSVQLKKMCSYFQMLCTTEWWVCMTRPITFYDSIDACTAMWEEKDGNLFNFSFRFAQLGKVKWINERKKKMVLIHSLKKKKTSIPRAGRQTSVHPPHNGEMHFLFPHFDIYIHVDAE